MSGAPRHQTVEDAAMPVGPIHHRGNAKNEVADFVIFIIKTNHLLRFRAVLIDAHFQ
jgi:hypothetical protein